VSFHSNNEKLEEFNISVAFLPTFPICAITTCAISTEHYPQYIKWRKSQITRESFLSPFIAELWTNSINPPVTSLKTFQQSVTMDHMSS